MVRYTQYYSMVDGLHALSCHAHAHEPAGEFSIRKQWGRKKKEVKSVKHTWIYLLTLAILAHCTAPLCQRTMFCRPPRSHQSEVEEKQLELSLLWKGKKK